MTKPSPAPKLQNDGLMGTQSLSLALEKASVGVQQFAVQGPVKQGDAIMAETHRVLFELRDNLTIEPSFVIDDDDQPIKPRQHRQGDVTLATSGL